MENGWTRLRFVPDDFTPYDRTHLKKAAYETAFHGTGIECIFTQLHTDRLLDSGFRGEEDKCKKRGEQFFENCPGVYVHGGDESGTTGKHPTYKKAMNYCRYVNLFGDGRFYTAMWEVQVDRNRCLSTCLLYTSPSPRD